MPQKLILSNKQSPGDLVMMLYALTSLHDTYPGEYITDVRVSARDLFAENPLITPIDNDDPDARLLKMEYPQINDSNSRPYRFSTAFTAYLSDQIGRPIKPANFASVIPLADNEKGWYSAMHEVLKRDVPYWVLNAGHKSDFTAKTWSFARYQELVDSLPDVQFVQVGSKEHIHPELRGQNLTSMVGKTDTRQLIRLVYNAFGVISGVSFPMHLAYAVPAHPRFGRPTRANITIAGGREPAHWEQGPDHHYLHTSGMLSCCAKGGCWKSRVVALKDNDDKNNSLCEAPMMMEDGQWVPKCMVMIEVDDVAKLVRRYMDNLDYSPKS